MSGGKTNISDSYLLLTFLVLKQVKILFIAIVLLKSIIVSTSYLQHKVILEATAKL